MLRVAPLLLALTMFSALPARADVGVTLRGSRASMLRQNQVAQKNDYTFLRTSEQVREFVEKGYLVPIESNADYEVDDGVSFPFARPEMRTFIERLSAQHREGCGEKLVVTSLTRPQTGQPWNSHPLSVHPTGMAVDLRVNDTPACVRWLENTLLSLEKKGLLDVTRERRPPHFHVALFTGAYRAYVEPMIAAERARAEAKAKAEAQARAEAERALRELQVANAYQQASVAPAPDRHARADTEGRIVLVSLTVVAVGLALTARRRRRSTKGGFPE
jgi:hypothetical protein